MTTKNAARKARPKNFLLKKLVVILAVIAVFGLWWFNRSRVPNSWAECVNMKGSRILESYPGVCITPAGQHFTEPISQPGASHDLTDNWKNYFNTGLGIAFSYPPAFNVTETDGQVDLTNGFIIHVQTPKPDTILVDNLHLMIVEKSGSLQSISGAAYQDINQSPMNIGGHSYYTSWIGVEGMGEYKYYLQKGENDWLVFTHNRRNDLDVSAEDRQDTRFLTTVQQEAVIKQILGRLRLLGVNPELGRLHLIVTTGPTQPFFKDAEPSSKPYAFEVLSILRAGTQNSVATVTTDGNGEVNVGLPAGNYSIQSKNPPLVGGLLPSNFTITAGQTTSLNLDVDTGIR